MNESYQNTSIKTNQKILTQQVFHPGLFNRPRSASLCELANTQKSNPDTHQEEPKPDESPIQLNDTSPPNPIEPPPWQRIPHTNKRKRTSDSPPSKTPLTVSNRFSTLPLEQAENPSSDNDKPKTNKPPPIVLYGIEDVNELSKLIEPVCNSQLFKIRIVNKNLLRVLVDCPETYKNVIATIRAKGLIGHTFTPKDKKPYRIVIRKLHHTTPHSEITKAIEATGNKVCGEIINARYGSEKVPSFTFFVNIERNENNKAVKDIKSIYHQHVIIEDPRKSTTIVQCQRCQQYGHSKNNCMRPFRCVKCGQGHKTSDCPKKDRNTPAKCALCFCDHPANYKGCQVYMEILAKKGNSPKINTLRPPTTKKQTPHTQTEAGEPNTSVSQATQPRDKRTYSDVTATRNNPVSVSEPKYNSQQYSTIEQILIKQSEKIDLLIQQIGTLLNLLTTVVTKLQC